MKNEGEGEVKSEDVEGLSITVNHAEGDKCPRCWNWSHTVGTDADYPDVCARCAAALRG
ncbi:MAG: zinc finger domain-containing protein [Acutalibacteraceae bacterium]